MKKPLVLVFLLFPLMIMNTEAQEEKLNVSFYDGIFIGGYIDQGGFLNFTGPNINATYGNSKFIIGMLPSLRFKKDRSTPKNAFATPNLGIGFTYSYKIWAIQLPLYYNPKTPTENGRWHIGIGVGLRLNEFNER
ncbi:DUF3575 domain-containing protein [Cecembia calidifontis]|uniref:Outer membrane protein with beta-barrel domain n=1 Tax=Cecembia calidifontis TaxID=1187080 RepID=A0A4Q7P4F9_9BACT|nr:DUF3575 domain-containing protein [Cecembia calidifontis]RZS94861.1 hypothetical protein BC751_0372 [Cecembia calidifontis]